MDCETAGRDDRLSASDRLAPVTHYGFYILVLLMAATGLATAVVSGLNLIVFGDSHARLPPSLTIYPTRVAHGYIAAILAGFIVLHVLAALYHQLVLRDGLIEENVARPPSLGSADPGRAYLPDGRSAV